MLNLPWTQWKNLTYHELLNLKILAHLRNLENWRPTILSQHSNYLLVLPRSLHWTVRNFYISSMKPVICCQFLHSGTIYPQGFSTDVVVIRNCLVRSCSPFLFQKALLHQTSNPLWIFGQSSPEFKKRLNQASKISCWQGSGRVRIVLLRPSSIRCLSSPLDALLIQPKSS